MDYAAIEQAALALPRYERIELAYRLTLSLDGTGPPEPGGPEAALSLPAAPRETLACKLIASLTPPPAIEEEPLPQSEIDAAWQSEIQRRIKETETGAVKPIPYAEMLPRARKLLAMLQHLRRWNASPAGSDPTRPNKIHHHRSDAMDCEQIQRDALALPDTERAALAHCLLQNGKADPHTAPMAEWRKVHQAALALPEAERDELCRNLLVSLEPQEGLVSEAEAEASWLPEIRRRVAEIDRGEAQMIPHAEVMRKAREILKLAKR